MHEIWRAHPDKPIGLIRACEPHTASSRRNTPCETSPTMILQTHSGDSGRLLPTLERRSSRLCGSPFSREIQGGLCLPWLDGDWCFRVAPRNAFTRVRSTNRQPAGEGVPSLGFAYDATFTDDVSRDICLSAFTVMLRLRRGVI